jgi:hypothetical protein
MLISKIGVLSTPKLPPNCAYAGYKRYDIIEVYTWIIVRYGIDNLFYSYSLSENSRYSLIDNIRLSIRCHTLTPYGDENLSYNISNDR